MDQDNTPDDDQDLIAIHVSRTTRRGPALMITITINNHEVDAVVDTGAEVTLLSTDFCTRIGINVNNVGKRAKLKNAEHNNYMMARADVPVQIGVMHYKFKWNIYVAAISDDVLLGLDFLQMADIMVRARGGLFLGDTPLPCRMVVPDGSSYTIPSVELARKTTIPARSQVIAKASICGQLDWESALMEPDDLPDGLLAARVLVCPGNAMPICICNATNSPITLCKGKVLGYLFAADVLCDTEMDESRREVTSGSESQAFSPQEGEGECLHTACRLDLSEWPV